MNPWMTDAMAREHMADLGGRPGPRIVALREGRARTSETVGWWLIGLGQRLVRIDAEALRLARA